MNNFNPTQNNVKKNFRLEDIPSEIKQLRQWVLWNAKKLPLTIQKTAASSSDPNTWNTFDACKTALDSQILWKSFVGVGFVFADSGYVGIDIDDAFPLSEPVQELITKFSSYTEISQSGNGLHIIIKGVKPRSECNFTYKGKRIEVYAVGRYFAMTGNLFRADNAIYERQTELDELFAEAFPETAAIPEPKPFPRQSKVQPLAGEDYFINAVIQVLQEDGRGMFDTYQDDATKQDFLRLGFALKSKNLPFEVFDSVVCGSQNYDPEENRSLYDGLKPKYVNFGTAYEYAKRANPDKLKELLRAGAKAHRDQQQPKQQAENCVNLTLSSGHLSDLPLSDALTGVHDIAIHAGTGTGKTYFALNTLPKMFPGFNVLILEPTIILAKQKAKDAKNEDIHVIVDNVQPNGGKLQIGTYNAIEKFSDDWLKNAVVVIDEAHQLTPCQGYRRHVIQALKTKTALCQKRIYMTGTPIPFGAGYAPDMIINIQSPFVPIPVDLLEAADKSKAIEKLHIKGKTTLVYVFSRRRCKQLKVYFEKKGYRTGMIHSKSGKTILHKNLIDGNMIDRALDFVFVTSYPSEGVDIDEHNIDQIVVVDFCPVWTLKQLTARTRKTHIEKVTVLFSVDAESSQGFPFSAQYAAKMRQYYHDAAEGIAAIKNAQLQVGRYDKGVQKVRKDLAGQIENAVRKIEKPLPGCPESFSFAVDPDYIEYLVYLEYERAFRGNREYFISELNRVGFVVNETVNKITDTKNTVEKEIVKRSNEEIKQEEQQEFEQDLQDAAQMEEEELFQQYEEESDAKTRLRLLTQELGDRILATKILQVIGRNTGKFNQALKQARFRSYLKGKHKSVTLEKLRRLGKVGEMFTSQEIYDLMKPVYDSDPHLVNVSEGLRKTRQRFTPERAVRAFQIFFDTERTSYHTNEGKQNVYRIISCDPLAKFEAVELRSELVLTHICHENIKQFYDKSESENRVYSSAIDLENQPLTAFMSQEFSEYAETQLKTFGEVF